MSPAMILDVGIITSLFSLAGRAPISRREVVGSNATGGFACLSHGFALVNCCCGSRTICCGRSECVGPRRSSAFNAPPIASTLLLTGLLAPIPIQYPRRQRQSHLETTLQTVVGVPSRCHLELPSHKQPQHTTAAGRKFGGKPKDANTLKCDQSGHVAYDDPGCWDHRQPL